MSQDNKIYSTDNIVNNIITTLYGNRCYHSDHFVMYTIMKSLCCTLKTNILLGVSYI